MDLVLVLLWLWLCLVLLSPRSHFLDCLHLCLDCPSCLHFHDHDFHAFTAFLQCLFKLALCSLPTLDSVLHFSGGLWISQNKWPVFCYVVCFGVCIWVLFLQFIRQPACISGPITVHLQHSKLKVGFMWYSLSHFPLEYTAKHDSPVFWCPLGKIAYIYWKKMGLFVASFIH